MVRALVGVAVLVGALGSGVPAEAQQRLPDAAKGLSLNHPEGETIIVLEGEEGEAGDRPGVTGDDLVFMAQQLMAHGTAAESVLAEIRSDDLFFDEGWHGRVLDAVSNVERALRDLAFAQVPERYREGVSRVLEGGRRYQMAGGILSWSIAQDQPVFSGAFDQFTAGNRGVTAGLVKLRVERDAEEAEQPLPPPDPFTARQASAALCGRQYGEGERAGYDLCVERQHAALQAMNRRFGFSSGLDEPVFNSIRSRCRGQWPDDMVVRDRCEQVGIEQARAR